MSNFSAPSLAGRRVLLGVTGGIAAYKSADLARRLKDAGADVQVVMTEAATRFVGPQTFQAVSGRPVRQSLWDEAGEAAMGHIELARWPDAILIAPASANTLARLAHGFADDLLSTLCLATDRPIFCAPAMNRLMWANPATQTNARALQDRGVTLFGPGSGSQACGETGDGRMLDPLELVARLAQALSGGPLQGVHAVVTAGPTHEAVDPVRVLTNRSSGKMGFAVAEALARLGAQVSLIAGPVSLSTPPGVKRIDVQSADDMLQASLAAADQAQIFVGTAAVADYRPAQTAPGKIKKSSDTLSLALSRTEDILSTVRDRHPALFMVGFAAETESLVDYARDKLRRKHLQMVAANEVGGGRAFDVDDNHLIVVEAQQETDLGHAPKTELARALAELIAARYLALNPSV